MADRSFPNFSGGHRSAFSQTCNLLSQYVKEKQTIGDLSLGMLANADERGQSDAFRPSMMKFFHKKPTEDEQISSNAQSMDLFPQQACFASQSSEQKSSDLTIFYAGQVIVFNDFPAHKAKEIIALAKRGGVTESSHNDTKPNDSTPAMKANVINSKQVEESPQHATKSAVTDLPIARKASLHRFLEKRKDRIKARAPYNTIKPEEDLAVKKADEGNSWLGLAAVQAS